jgi:hypothetical protein
MSLTETTRTGPNGTTSRCVLLRQSYREGGEVKNRTIAHLSHCPPEEVAAIRLALQQKDDLTVLGTVKDVTEIAEGRSVGAVWTVDEVARRLGIEAALGTDFAGKLAMWQVIARVIDQGSRLAAVRLASPHAACEVLRFTRGVDEKDLYDNLAWLTANQATIERRFFAARRGHRPPALFLYDVTSSSLEGQCNALAAFGSNRAGTVGKKHVVIGLVCDEEGAPVSTEVCAGNPPAMTTVAAQMTKVARRFGGERVTFVGDRGMSKSSQMEALSRAGFSSMTAITKPQRARLIQDEVLHLALCGAQVKEVAHAGCRSIFRRTPLRAEDMAVGRRDKHRSMERWVAQKTPYLHDHPRAHVAVALREAQAKLARLKMDPWLKTEAEGRTLRVIVQEAALQAAARLDGCSVLQTDLPQTMAAAEVVQDR